MAFEFRYRTATIAAAVLISGVTADVWAGDWTTVPRFSIGGTYSDNVNLDPSNERGDFIINATPGLSVRGEGRRVQLNLDYNLQSLTYAKEGTNNTINHQLQSGASIEVLRDVFFLDADASFFQALISNTGTISNRNFQVQNNRGDVLTYGITPSFRHHFGSWADMRASTGFSDTIAFGSSGGRTAGSGNGIDLSTSLSSGRKFTRTSWSVSNNRSLFNNDSGARSSSRSSWDASGSVHVNRLFRFNGSLGYENNDFEGPGDGKGVTWDVGGTLTPSRRTSLTGSYGHHSFGNTKQFDFSHSRRRISINGSYTEALRTTNDQLRNQQLIPLVDAFGEPVFDPLDASDIDNPLDTLTRTDDVFVSRDFTAAVGYTRRRDDFSASVYRTERDSGESSGPEKAIGTSLSWNRTFSGRLSGGISGDYRSGTSSLLEGGDPNLNADGESDVDVIIISPFISYSIGPNTSGNFSYSYTSSSSDDRQNEYTENSLSASLSFAF